MHSFGISLIKALKLSLTKVIFDFLPNKVTPPERRKAA